MAVGSNDVQLDMNYTLTQKKELLILGISPKNWGIIFAIFAVLYTCYGLIFWGFLAAALNLRQEEWLQLPSGNFGKFDTSSLLLYNWDATGSQIGYATADKLDYQEKGKVAQWNRPDGCTVKEVSEADEIERISVLQPENRVLMCSQDDSRQYTLFPWVRDLQSNGNANAVYGTGCGSVSEQGTPANQRFTQEDFFLFQNLQALGSADSFKYACLNVVPKFALVP
eukprot:TRINITY_DN4919_c1_g2_i1.p1 TRINITY_DN4919_c1_g2~~TRINITY_DN4919_c1_g2_i1.p1  ORF type:complete len:225 (-),score=22.28 TRINITY_DN4919_c1_g2_i1:103-777(-)